jgi:hypothetical protein
MTAEEVRASVAAYEEPRKVYLVTSGSYSDYGVDAVFDTREGAELFIATFRRESWMDAFEIEEWNLNPFEPQMRAGLLPFFVDMRRDGETIAVRAADAHDTKFYAVPVVWNNDRHRHNHCAFVMMATDETHAVKIANERRVQMIAMNEWPEDAE